MPPETIAMPPQTAGPRRRHRPDWNYAAELIADGVSPDVVADLIGTRLKYVRRQLRQSRLLARRIALYSQLAGVPAPAASIGVAAASDDRRNKHPSRQNALSPRWNKHPLRWNKHPPRWNKHPPASKGLEINEVPVLLKKRGAAASSGPRIRKSGAVLANSPGRVAANPYEPADPGGEEAPDVKRCSTSGTRSGAECARTRRSPPT